MDTSRVWNRSVSVRRTVLLLDQFHILMACDPNIGANPPREVEGKVMTHCVPNEHVKLTQ